MSAVCESLSKWESSALELLKVFWYTLYTTYKHPIHMEQLVDSDYSGMVLLSSTSNDSNYQIKHTVIHGSTYRGGGKINLH